VHRLRLFLDPDRRRAFEFADQFRDGPLFTKPTRNMHVIFDAANDVRRAIEFVADAG
jgi:hypothetical protein